MERNHPIVVRQGITTLPPDDPRQWDAHLREAMSRPFYVKANLGKVPEFLWIGVHAVKKFAIVSDAEFRERFVTLTKVPFLEFSPDTDALKAMPHA